MLDQLRRVMALWPRRETVALAKRKLERELRQSGLGRGAAKTEVARRFRAR